MTRLLTSQTLRGLWSAVPTPWNVQGKLDPGVLTENCARLAAANVDGIYTTDADGEFYAVELDEFREFAGAFGKAMQSSGVDAAMGISWFNTQGVVDRAKAAIDAGVPNVHVALPMFMPLAKDDVDRFFADVADAVPDLRWIHYAHPQSRPALRGSDYARLATRFPQQFIGTKIAAVDDITELTEIIVNAPMLSHQVSDPTLGVAMFLGASGNCSYWVNTLPRWSRQYMDACLERRWDEVSERHRKLRKWEIDHVSMLKQLGHRHGIIGKSLGRLSGFLVDTGHTRPPYQPVSDEVFRALKSAFEQYWAQELAAEGLPR